MMLTATVSHGGLNFHLENFKKEQDVLSLSIATTV